MSLDYSSLYKNFKSVIDSYQDISTIYSKLFFQGHIEKLGGLLTEIYDDEHVFTLTELQKYCKVAGQKEDGFVAEQYEMNSLIFRRNLTLIVQNLVEEIGKKYIDRFRQDYISVSNFERAENQSEQPEQATEEEEAPEESIQQRIVEPQVQERTENKTNISKAHSKSVISEGENRSAGNKSFDISMHELANRANVQQMHKTAQSANEISSQAARPHVIENYQPTHSKKVIPVNYEFDDNSKHGSPVYNNRADGSTFAHSEAKGEEYSPYDREMEALKVQQEKLQASRHKPSQETYNFWSSSENTSVQGRKTNIGQPEPKVVSPEKFGASMFGYSYSKWSTTNGRPDMSILDSEFSYGQGRSFSRSPKKFHHQINDLPGPGRYELDESMQITKSKSPNRSFTKSPKTPSYFKKSAVPGAIYYPTKHFLSK